MVWTLDTTEGRAPLVERNALLSEDAKGFIAEMHAADPKWCAAAEVFRGLGPPVRAIKSLTCAQLQLLLMGRLNEWQNCSSVLVHVCTALVIADRQDR